MSIPKIKEIAPFFPLIGAIIILIGYQSYKYFYPNVNGYCYSQQRIISDEEFIRIALKNALTEPSFHRPDIDGTERSIQDFHKNHPDCCHILRVVPGKEPSGTTYSDIWHVIVGMQYKTLEKLSLSERDLDVSFTVMDECGNILGLNG